MSIPESIPEDRYESYPCRYCLKGNIIQRKDKVWECDSCSWDSNVIPDRIFIERDE